MKFVKAQKPVTTKHEKLGELSVDVEAPQAESVEEFVTFCGGADNALNWINGNLETASKNVGRAAMRNLPSDLTPEKLPEAMAKIQTTVREYTPQAGERGPSKAKKAEILDNAKQRLTEALASGRQLSAEELLAMLEASN